MTKELEESKRRARDRFTGSNQVVDCIPVDGKEHIEGRSCWCRPIAEPCGNGNQIIIHRLVS